MSEGVDAVNTKNRYLVTVLRQELRITFDVYFFQRVKVTTAGPDQFCFHLFTKMTTGSGIENHVCFGFQFVPL
jgi:hypothetical protein